MITGLHRIALIALFGGGFLVSGLVGCATTPSSSVPPQTDSKATRGAITGLKAELIDQETALPDGRVAWSRRWRLCWDPVPGAVAYVVTSITPEGVGPPGDTTDRCLVPLTVASGIADRPGERPGPTRQFDPMQRLMLSFSVAARLADGATGPFSPAVAAGSELR